MPSAAPPTRIMPMRSIGTIRKCIRLAAIRCWRASSISERIWSNLEVHHLRVRAFSGLAVERRSSAPSGPDSLAFPAGLRIVDAAVHPLGEEAERIRYAQHHELSVHQSEQRIG